MKCYHCGQQVMTVTSQKAGTITWALCSLLCIVGCFCGCCLIPFCANPTQDIMHNCPSCKQFLGAYERIKFRREQYGTIGAGVVGINITDALTSSDTTPSTDTLKVHCLDLLAALEWGMRSPDNYDDRRTNRDSKKTPSPAHYSDILDYCFG
ncbi:unnamed protein product [Medioppia subpectinata]|uniref:LITAF domain-containing protein n=1 Tax=Medioppia subpectinata TaxID=1979941 RepID=A0A7R9LG43_9ACAR|nr:unnamed protein product [Medioppia subpectinata]CAG2117948.1 unnamed protein product [Medioppia subpectinata]